MTITYQIESWTDYYRDCQELWIEHYNEIARDKDKMPMSPDIEAFKFLESRGQLQILTVRQDGKMIGYQLTIIRNHLHYAVLCGFEDSYFLKKDCRKGMAGVRMIKEAIKHMQIRGVKKVFFLTKAFLNRGKIFEYLGFTQSDIMYAKWIGN